MVSVRAHLCALLVMLTLTLFHFIRRGDLRGEVLGQIAARRPGLREEVVISGKTKAVSHEQRSAPKSKVGNDNREASDVRVKVKDLGPAGD